MKFLAIISALIAGVFGVDRGQEVMMHLISVVALPAFLLSILMLGLEGRLVFLGSGCHRMPGGWFGCHDLGSGGVSEGQLPCRCQARGFGDHSDRTV